MKTSLVLEGGGMRGAYTAGALSWLIDNGIEFDSAYGISTGAVHLCNFLMKDKKNLFDFAIDYITNKNVLFLNAILRCGYVVDYDYMFNELLKKQVKYDITPLKDVKTDGQIGVYDLSIGKTIFVKVQDMTYDQLKASTTLPLLGKIVVDGDRQILDGGITEMIPIKKSVEDGCNKHLVITTKPADYVRKPAKSIVVKIMSAVYKKCPSIGKDYEVRHLNYLDQINTIKSLENTGNAVYVYPSKPSNVSRLGGKREDLVSLFELGRSDMETRKEDIFKLLGINA